jgi:uncharacterized LabA/DUF88 family protein
MKVWFFIDGFNFYHSVQSALKEKPNSQLMWIDLKLLCEQHLHVIGPHAKLAGVDYFTAIPEHLISTHDAKEEAKDKVLRHKLYIRANEAAGVGIHLGFIDRNGKSKVTGDGATVYEWREKGTDVKLACTVLERAKNNDYELALIVSGDTDYLPLVEILPRMYEKEIRFCLPYKRDTKMIKAKSPKSFALSLESYEKCQFPTCITLPNGTRIHCPPKWLPKVSS